MRLRSSEYTCPCSAKFKFNPRYVCSVPFDDTNIFVYVTLSIAVVIGTGSGGFCHIAVNTTFVGVAFNCVASLQDLKDTIKKIDVDPSVPIFGRMDAKTSALVKKRHVVQDDITLKVLHCMHFHTKLLQ